MRPESKTIAGMARGAWAGWRSSFAHDGNKRRVQRWIWTGLLVLAAASLDAGQRLTMTVSPALSFAPANMWVRVSVEPHADNRALEVIADSGDFYRSSVVPLDGDHAARAMVLEFRSVPGGAYDVRAVLRDGAGQEQAFAHQEVIVLSSGGDR